MENEKKELIEAFIPNDPDYNKPKLQKAMDFDVRTKSIEEKTYIILYRISGATVEDFDGLFDVKIGRTETYESIKSHLMSGMDIDIHASKIITEIKLKDKNEDKKYFLIPYDECISIYAFFNSVRSYFPDDDFDIEDYNITKTDLDDEETIQRSREQKEYEETILQSLKDDKFSISFMNNNSSTNNNV